ncbi:MAG: alpha-galactosidase, partial [Sphingobacteriales bacterium]
FLYTVATTGKRPILFSADGLPSGLELDRKTGIITGKVSQRGTHKTTLKAQNALGEAIRHITIKIGDTIALTPPIGWNGWNSWETRIDREKVIASADAMVKMGLINHGWTYINIDDAWQGKRGGPLNALQPNEKFPDFKGMVAYIHALGLKAGLYSTPYISSYGGYVGASSDFANGGESHESIMVNRRAFNHIAPYRFETEDARQMAEWGIDFLKYDWRIDVNSAERMSTALRQSGRDIVFSLSNSAPFVNVKDWMRLSNMYRTGPDIRDSWTSLYQLAFTLDKWAPYNGPGHWNDPDMMILGNVSTGPELHPTRLTPDEQYSHVSLFSLLSAPLLIGCPIEQLDAFTLNLLTNDEVIEINQDPLGKSARLVSTENGVQIWLKPLEDGSFAVGLFNVAEYGKTPESYFRWGEETAKTFTFDLATAGLKGNYRLRDVWRQKDLGMFERTFKTDIRHHGVALLRLFPVQ